MNRNKYRFKAMLWRIADSTAAYVIFPGDIRQIFGKGLVYAHVTVDDLEFDCSIMNKGHKHYKKRPTYTISINRDKLQRLGKIYGDMVTVTVKERESEKQISKNSC